MNLRIALLALALAAPAAAAPGGRIDVLQTGDYICETAGDATGAAGIHSAADDFTVHNASTYSNGGANGTYLVTGDLVAMTSGPKRGQKFRRLSGNFLRQLDASGKDGALRCVRRVVNNS